MMLLKAAHFGVDEVIKPLLDAGADINYLGKRVSYDRANPVTSRKLLHAITIPPNYHRPALDIVIPLDSIPAGSNST